MFQGVFKIIFFIYDITSCGTKPKTNGEPTIFIVEFEPRCSKDAPLIIVVKNDYQLG